jgi:hypothetical protein
VIFLHLSVEHGMDLLLADECALWSPAGARLIMEHLDALSEDTGDPITFDRVAIRCEWSEYETIKDAAHAYGVAPKQLRDATTVLEHDPKRDSSKVVVIMNY